MNETKQELNLSVFNDSKGFFVLTTIIVVFMTIPAQMMKPEYVGYLPAVLSTILVLPLFALWQLYFWNKILLKVFPHVPKISYGVSLMFVIMISMLF